MTVSETRERSAAVRYSPDRPTLSVALGMVYWGGICSSDIG